MWGCIRLRGEKRGEEEKREKREERRRRRKEKEKEEEEEEFGGVKGICSVNVGWIDILEVVMVRFWNFNGESVGILLRWCEWLIYIVCKGLKPLDVGKAKA